MEQKLSSIQTQKEALTDALTNIKIKESELNTILHEKKKQYDDAFKAIPSDIQKENIDDTIEGCNEMIFASDRKISGYEERLKENNDRHTSIKAGLIQRQEQLAKWEKSLVEEEENL